MKHYASIAAIAVAAFGLSVVEATAACTPGGFVSYDGTTVVVDTTGCNLVAVDSVTGQGTLLSAGKIGVSDGTYTTTVEPGLIHSTDGTSHTIMTPEGVATTGSFFAVSGTSATLVTPSGLQTTDGTNTAVVAPVGFGVTDGATTTAVVAGGVAVTDGVTQATVVHKGGLVTQDASGNTTVVAPEGIATTGVVVANGVAANVVAAGVLATQDSAGTFYGNVGDTLSDHEGRLNKLNGRVDEAFEGVAMALAMESPQVDPGKRFGISLNYGNFEGEGAFAAAAKLRFDENFAGTAGVGYGQSGTVGFRAGVQAQW